jgi:hypothetical protein
MMEAPRWTGITKERDWTERGDASPQSHWTFYLFHGGDTAPLNAILRPVTKRPIAEFKQVFESK